MSGYASCVQIDDDRPRARVRLEAGHCWLAPVRFDAEAWNVPLSEQFGTGGGPTPARWRGHGVMVRDAVERARFFDDGGAVLAFVPADSRVASLSGQFCD